MATFYRITNPNGETREGLTVADVKNFKAAKGGNVPEGYVLESYEEEAPSTEPVKQEQKMRWHTPKEREEYAGGFARLFPYSTNGVLNGEGVTFQNAYDDLSTLGTRFLASGPLLGDGNMGYTSADYNDGSIPGLVKGIATNPVTSNLMMGGTALYKTVSSLAAKFGLPKVTQLIANIGGQGAFAALVNGIGEQNMAKYIEDSRGDWDKFVDTMKVIAGAGAGELLNQGLMKGINSYRTGKLNAAKDIYAPQQEAMTNIGMRGKSAFNNSTKTDKKQINNAYKQYTEAQMGQGIDQASLDATNLAAGEELESIMAMPMEDTPIGTGVVHKPKSLSVGAVGRQLSKDEIAWLEKISATREELMQNIKEAQAAKLEGKNLAEVFKDRIQVAKDVAGYREQNAQNATDAAVARKENEATILRNMSQSEADAARYAMQPVTEDIMMGEQAIMNVERQMEDITKRIEELSAKVSKRLEGDYTKETFTSLNDVHKKYPQYVTEATQEIDRLEKELSVLQNHLNMEDFVRGVDEYKYSATPKATEAYRASEEFADAANEAEGLISGIKEQGSFDKANAGFRGRNDVGTIERLRDEKMAPVLQRIEDAKKKVNETLASLGDMKAKLAEAKGTRSHNIENGHRQIVENTNGNMPEITTNKTTEDFYKNLLLNLEKAETADNTSYLAPGGYVKKNAQGVIIPPSDSRDVVRAKEVANEIYSVIENRAKAKGQEVGVKFDPKIYTQDIIYAVQRLVDRNNFSMADAVIQSCGWLSNAEKKSILENTIKNKFSTNLRKGYKNPAEFQEKQIGADSKMYAAKEWMKGKPGIKAVGKTMDVFVPDPRDVSVKDVQKAWNTLHDPKNYLNASYPGAFLPATGYGLVEGIRKNQK